MSWPGFEIKTQVRFFAYLLVFAGLGALLAWLFQWRTVLQIVPGRSFMACDTACCFIIAGLTFLFALRNATRVSRVLALLLFALGATYLWADLNQTWFSLHCLFPEFTRKVVAPFPLRNCRTSTATALAILQLGAFLLLMTYSVSGRIATSFAAFVATVLPAFGVLGILFSLAGGAEQDSWIGYLARMSLPTSACVFIAGLCACGLFWIKTERREHRHFSTAATLLLLGLLVLIASVNSVILSHGHVALRTTAEVQKIYLQIDLLTGAVDSIRKAETGQRGFLLTQNEQYLQIYESGVAAARAKLADLTADSSLDLANLRNLIDRKLSKLATAIDLQRHNRRQDALAIVDSGEGLAIMNQIDAESARLLLSLQTQRTGNFIEDATSLNLVQKTIILSSLVAALTIFAGIFIIWIEVAGRAHVEQQLREAGRDLQNRVEARTSEVRQYSHELECEVALRQEAAHQLRLSLDLAKVAIWTSFPDTRVIAWAGPVEQVFGVPADQLNSYSAFREIIYPADRDYVESLVKNDLGAVTRFESEFRIVLPSGELRWIGGMGNAVVDDNGNITRIAGINLDITARKQMEEKLATSELHFHGLAESVPQIVWAADARGEIDYHNEQWSRITGLPNGRLTPEVRQSVIHPDDRQSLDDFRSQATREGRAHDVEFRLFDVQHKEYRWHWLHVVPVRDDEGKIVRWFGTSTDVHQRKTAKLRLAESEGRLRNREQKLALVFESGSVGDYVWDLASGEIDAHPAVWALFGEPGRRGSAPANWFIRRIHPDDWDAVSSAIQTATTGANTFDVEARLLLPDGSVRWLTSRGFAARNHAGSPTIIHGLVFDNTDAKLGFLARARKRTPLQRDGRRHAANRLAHFAQRRSGLLQCSFLRIHWLPCRPSHLLGRPDSSR